MRDRRLLRTAAFAVACLCTRLAIAAAPTEGQLTVDGKTINIRYAYADLFDRSLRGRSDAEALEWNSPAGEKASGF